MKKSKSNQATLFQSWGHRQPSSSGSAVHRAKNQVNGETFHIFDPSESVCFGDEEDDDELLAAAAEIVPFDEANANFTGHVENSPSMPNHVSKSALDIEVIPGFDSEAGNVWIYPTNYPIRNYQYDIVGQALFKNTLVTLPTGLGKTFIAAVAMYNFYRWYPLGKVIFMAPTKPLVAQQIEACFNIMGIPQSDTAEMTGSMAPSKRQSLWQSRRVFFLTPQVLQNDLSRGSCVAEQVVLLVVDEAHKALGNHAYCQVVREVSAYTRNFRVLALSATPGDDVQAVQQVITNLLISHMELRTEDSPDIKPYTHSRFVEKVVVSLGDDISKVKRAYLKVLEGVVGRLFCKRALWQRDPQRVTKFQLLSARDMFRKKLSEQGGMDRTQAGFIEGDFAMCISLYHAYELLLQHGILSFYNFIKGIMDGTKGMSRAKSEITKNQEFTQIMDELRQEIEPPVEDSANSSVLFSQFSPRRRALMNAPNPSSSFKSHPKLIKLKEIVLEHFDKYQDEASMRANVVATRVMIFSQYRDSVNEIAAMLSQHKPAVRVMSFIGQQSTGKSSRGLTQKEQLQVVQRFRQGGYNTLVATCVGEEGLDIGEVDLIICFDAHASPIRLVQRMGRTGRKRDGRIVVLVTEGKEEQIYKKSQSKKNSIHKAVTQAAKSFDLYSHNPRMVPRHLTPQVLKMEMTVGKFVGQSKGKQKGRSSDGANIKAFTTKSGTSKKGDGLLTYEELVYWQENFKLPDHEAGFSPELHLKKNSRRSLVKPNVMSLSLSEWLPWQTALQPVKYVKHSRRTEHFTEILEFTELHGGTGDDNENYDLEMMSFLNDEDVLKPGGKDCSLEEVIVQEEVREVGVEIETTAVAKRDSTNKVKKSRRKIQESSEAAALSVVGENGSSSERECGRMTNVGKTTEKKPVKGVKKRSPQNKARWKEFLKQFDKEDEDFEADGGGEESGHLTQNDNGERGFCRLDGDEHYSPDGRLSSKPKKLTTETTDEPTMDEEGQIKTSDEGCFSDAASDDMANLLPLFTPGSQSCIPAVGALRSRGTMAAVPSPPPLDSLDKITSSPASVELEKLDKETEEDLWEETSKEAGSLLPSTKFCSMDTFLMSDFLQDDEECDPDDNDVTGRDRIKDVPCALRISDPCTSATPPILENQILEKASQLALLSCGNKKCKDLTSSRSSVQVRSTPKARDISRCHASPVKEDTHDARESSKEADSLSDFGAGVWCGSPPIEDCRDHDALIPVEGPTFSEVFFMDEMDDDDFPNLTILGEESGGNRVKIDEPAVDQTFSCDNKSVHNKMLTMEGLEETRCNSIESDFNTRNEDRIVRRVSSSKSLESAAGIDLTKAVSKLSSFAHNSKEDGVIDDRSKEPENETTKTGNNADVWTDYHRANNPVRTPTKGERTNNDVPKDNFLVSKTDRRSEFIAPTSVGIPMGSNVDEIGLKTGHRSSNSFLRHPADVEPDDKRLGLSQTSENIDADVNGTTRVVDDNCRSPHPKKLKLSLKRSSPKDKSVTRVVNCEKSTNCRKPLKIESSPQHSSILVGSKSVLSNNGDETGPGPLPSGTSEGSVSGHDVDRTPPKVPSIQHEECLSNTSKFRTKDGNIFAVMESDSDNDDDEDVIRPVGKGATLRRRAFSSPRSQDFKRPAVPGEGRPQAVDRGSHCQRRHGSESDEEFEHSKQVGRSSKVVEVKRKAQKRKSIEVAAKHGTKNTVKRHQNKVQRHEFLDDEAEQSGSDIGDFSSDEDDEEEDDGEMDSFIDDSSQLTQRTPVRLRSCAGSSPVDMLALYRQSLMSPLCGALNFKTPLFHKQRNRYKMVYNACDQNSNRDSEEEETYEYDSFIDDDVQGEGEYKTNESGNENTLDQSGLRGHTHAQLKGDHSFEESQIGRPINRMKRKRILDDSVDDEVSPNLSKQRHVLGQCNNESTIGKNATCILTSSKTSGNNLPKNSSFGNFPSKARTVGTAFQTDFVNSSDILAANKQHQVNRRSADSDRDLSMRTYGTYDDDWVGDVSDSELLVALQDGETSPERASVTPCLPTKETINDHELDEIAAALEMADSDVSIEISEIPTFSLHFDFLSEFADVSSSEENSNPARMKQVSFSDDHSTSCAVKFRKGVRRDSDLNNKTSLSKSERFGMANAGCGEEKINGSVTKIIQCSHEGGLKFSHPPENCSTVLQENFQSNFKKLTNTTALPQREQNPNIPTEGTLNSRLGPLLSLEKGTLQYTGQRTHGVGNAHKPQQIVTPSCRTNSLGTTPVLSPLLTSSLKDKGKTVILVDSREISSSQVVSSLRLKHNIKAEVCQLNGCDYIVSNRMAVKRKTVSDVCNGAHSQKLVDCMRLMCDLYDRPCLIIEKDRVKPGETEKNSLKTKAYLFSLACVGQTHVKLVFSESQDETARLLTDLAAIEAKKGMAITAPTSMTTKTAEQVFRVLLSFPRVSYITALNLCFSFKSLQEITNSNAADILLNSTPVDLQKRCSCLSSSRATEIHKHIRHKFNPSMVATKK